MHNMKRAHCAVMIKTSEAVSADVTVTGTWWPPNVASCAVPVNATWQFLDWSSVEQGTKCLQRIQAQGYMQSALFPAPIRSLAHPLPQKVLLILVSALNVQCRVIQHGNQRICMTLGMSWPERLPIIDRKACDYKEEKHSHLPLVALHGMRPGSI